MKRRIKNIDDNMGMGSIYSSYSKFGASIASEVLGNTPTNIALELLKLILKEIARVNKEKEQKRQKTNTSIVFMIAKNTTVTTTPIIKIMKIIKVKCPISIALFFFAPLLLLSSENSSIKYDYFIKLYTTGLSDDVCDNYFENVASFFPEKSINTYLFRLIAIGSNDKTIEIRMGNYEKIMSEPDILAKTFYENNFREYIINVRNKTIECFSEEEFIESIGSFFSKGISFLVQKKINQDTKPINIKCDDSSRIVEQYTMPHHDIFVFNHINGEIQAILSKEKESAEIILEKFQNKGYDITSLSPNVIKLIDSTLDKRNVETNDLEKQNTNNYRDITINIKQLGEFGQELQMKIK